MTDALQVDVIPDGDRGTVRLEDHFDTDIADVWSAITDPERTARWIAVVTGDYLLDDELSAELRQLGAELKFKPLWIDDLISLAHSLLKVTL